MPSERAGGQDVGVCAEFTEWQPRYLGAAFVTGTTQSLLFFFLPTPPPASPKLQVLISCHVFQDPSVTLARQTAAAAATGLEEYNPFTDSKQVSLSPSEGLLIELIGLWSWQSKKTNRRS